MGASRENVALLPCPFCGGTPEVVQEGTPRHSCIIVCSECGCEVESGEIGYSQK